MSNISTETGNNEVERYQNRLDLSTSHVIENVEWIAQGGSGHTQTMTFED